MSTTISNDAMATAGRPVRSPGLPVANPELRVAITGAGGFLGSALARSALSAGWKTRIVSRREPPRGAEWIASDFEDPFELGRAFSGAAVVIHAAGLAHQRGEGSLDAGRFEQINVEGTRRAVLAAQVSGVRHFVLISSVSVYGPKPAPPDESRVCRPESPYGRSKLRAEREARRLIESRDAVGQKMRLTILRMGTLYGPGDPGNVSQLMDFIDRGRFVFPGRCSQRKSLLHVEDAAAACLLAARSPVAGVFNVVGPAATMREIALAIAEVLGRDSSRMPQISERIVTAASRVLAAAGKLVPLARRVETTMSRFLATDEFDGHRFESATGFAPRVPLYIGLAQQAAWFRVRSGFDVRSRRWSSPGPAISKTECSARP